MPVIDVGGDPYWRQATSKLGQIWSGGNEGQRVLTAEKALQARQQTDETNATTAARQQAQQYINSTDPTKLDSTTLGRSLAGIALAGGDVNQASGIGRLFLPYARGAQDPMTTNALVADKVPYGSTYHGERMSQGAAMARQNASDAAATSRALAVAGATPREAWDPAINNGQGGFRYVTTSQAVDPAMGLRAPVQVGEVQGQAALAALPTMSPEQRAEFGGYAPKAANPGTPWNYIVPGGETHLVTDASYANGMDAQGRPIPRGGYRGAVQGSATDAGIPKSNVVDVTRSNRAVDLFDRTLNYVENLVQKNPTAVGVPGALQSATQDARIIADGLAQSFGARSAPEAVSAIRGALIQQGADPELLKAFDPAPDQITSAYQILVYQIANILGPGDRIAKDDVQRAMMMVGDPNSFRANPASLMSKFEPLRQLSADIKAANARSLAGGNGLSPAAGGMPPPAAAPQVVGPQGGARVTKTGVQYTVEP